MSETPAVPVAAADWVPDANDFASRLAAVRHRMRWNTKEAARECGVPAATWRLWEEGAMPRNLITICMAIHGRTGVDLDWLVYGPVKPAVNPGRVPTDRYAPVDLIAPRVIGKVGHGDRRRQPRGRVTPVRFGTPVWPSTGVGRSVSLIATV